MRESVINLAAARTLVQYMVHTQGAVKHSGPGLRDPPRRWTPARMLPELHTDEWTFDGDSLLNRVLRKHVARLLSF